MPTKYKLTAWHGLILLLSWEFWRYLSYLFNSAKPDFEPVGVANFIILSSVLAVGLMMFSRKWHALSFGATHGLFYLVYFGFNPLNFVGVAILIGLLFVSRFQMNSELNERFKVNARAVLRRGMMGVVLGIFVLISFAAYESPLAAELEETQRLPSSAERFIAGVVRSTIGTQLEGSEQEKQTIIVEVSRQTLQELNNFVKPYFKFAPPLLAFAVFLILWGLSWFFIQLSVLVGMLVFWILKKTKMVRIEERDVKAEALIV